MLAFVLSNLLYNKRFGCYIAWSVIAGIDPFTKKPYLCALCDIGSMQEVKDFVVIGTSLEYVLCLCEGM